MGFRIFAALACFVVLASSQGNAQPQPTPPDVGQGGVTILTDGIANPNGPALRVMSELSRHLDKIGDMRVLPLMGYGGAANVRDLLKLRGADLALLNSDVLAYLDQVKTYPEARSRLRYVTALFDQKVFLVARKEIASLDQLTGKTVAVLEGSAGQITAVTIFGLRKIPAKILPQRSGEALSMAIKNGADAMLLLEQDLALVPQESGLHLLPIPVNDRLAKVYRTSKIEPSESPGLPISAPIETVKVATLLATFDWKKTHVRFPHVSRFIGELFVALPKLRSDNPNSVWVETDVQEKVLDWQRFSAADVLRATVIAHPRRDGAEVSFANQANLATQNQANRDTPKTRAEEGNPVAHILISPRPPLTDPEQPGGGLIAELVASALGISGKAEAGKPPAAEVTWIQDQGEQLKTVFKDGTSGIAIAWDRPNCDSPEDLGPSSVVMCDNAVFSDAIFQSVLALFTRADANLTFADDASLAGKTVCLPEGADVSDLNRDNRRWISDKIVNLVRAASSLDCIILVEQGKADGLLMHELEGRVALRRLGILPQFRIAERPVAVRTLHAIAAKNSPRAVELIGALNDGLARLKQTGGYAEIVQKQLSPFWREMRADAKP
jgi:ABC-type amino acid transport substrate-binding protein